jgi:hypothetical protein
MSAWSAAAMSVGSNSRNAEKLAWRDNDLHTRGSHCAGDVLRKSSIDDQDVNAGQRGEIGKVIMTLS